MAGANSKIESRNFRRMRAANIFSSGRKDREIKEAEYNIARLWIPAPKTEADMRNARFIIANFTHESRNKSRRMRRKVLNSSIFLPKFHEFMISSELHFLPQWQLTVDLRAGWNGQRASSTKLTFTLAQNVNEMESKIKRQLNKNWVENLKIWRI